MSKHQNNTLDEIKQYLYSKYEVTHDKGSKALIQNVLQFCNSSDVFRDKIGFDSINYEVKKQEIIISKQKVRT